MPEWEGVHVPGVQAFPIGSSVKASRVPSSHGAACSTNAGKQVVTVNAMRARKGEVEKRKGGPHREGAFEPGIELS